MQKIRSLAVLAAVLFGGAGAKAQDLPLVPKLETGQGKSFVVSGEFSDGGGVRLEWLVVSDGVAQLVAVVDPADRTPIFLSNGEETLVYDLKNDRIVRLKQSRAHVSWTWEAAAERPGKLSFGVRMNTHEKKLGDQTSAFRVDHFVADAMQHFEQKPIDGGLVRRSDMRRPASTFYIEQRPGDPAWFRWGFTGHGDRKSSGVFEARLVSRPVPPELLRYPDIEQLRAQIKIVEVDVNTGGFLEFLAWLRDGRTIMLKMDIADEANRRTQAERDRDVVLGRAYREALAKQDLPLLQLPTTQPAK